MATFQTFQYVSYLFFYTKCISFNYIYSFLNEYFISLHIKLKKCHVSIFPAPEALETGSKDGDMPDIPIRELFIVSYFTQIFYIIPTVFSSKIYYSSYHVIPWAIPIMHSVCSLEIKVVTTILPQFSSLFSVDPSLTSTRNQSQMAPARLNCWLLHSVHPHFELPLILIL